MSKCVLLSRSARKSNDRQRNRFREPRDGRTGRYSARETDFQEEDSKPNSEEEHSCTEESDLTTVLDRELDESASPSQLARAEARCENSVLRRGVEQAWRLRW